MAAVQMLAVLFHIHSIALHRATVHGERCAHVRARPEKSTMWMHMSIVQLQKRWEGF